VRPDDAASVDWLWIALPVVALASDMAIQMLTFRVKGRRDPWASILLGVAAGLLVVIAGSVWAARRPGSADAIALMAMNVVSFVALAYGYFAFVNLNFTSLRVRFLRELIHFDRPVSAVELLGVYDARQALALRLDRLLEKGQLVERSGRYYVEGTNSFLLLAYILDFLKWLILGRPWRADPNSR
jgi:hypothetical protein